MLILGSASFANFAYALSVKESDAKTKEIYNNAKQQYNEEVNFYKTSKTQFLDAKTKYQQFKSAENKTALEDKARSYLEQAVKTLIKKIQTAKTWATNQRGLSDSEKNNLTAEMDKDIGWLNDRANAIKTADSTQIKAEAAKVLNYWKVHRARVKMITGKILAARINFILAKGDEFGDKVSQKITDLEAKSKDTSKLEAWLAGYKRKLELAKTKYESGKLKFNAIKGEPGFDPITELSEVDQLFTQGNQFIKEANQYIKEAHSDLVKIVKELKAQN